MSGVDATDSFCTSSATTLNEARGALLTFALARILVRTNVSHLMSAPEAFS